jgi:hypothetical protein
LDEEGQTANQSKIKYLIFAVITVTIAAWLFWEGDRKWEFEQTTTKNCRLSGSQGGVRVLFFGRSNSGGSSVKLTGPNVWQDILTNKIDWLGVETTKSTCQKKYSFLTFTEQTTNGLGEGFVSLKPSGKTLESCGKNNYAAKLIAAVLKTEGNIQIFNQQDIRLASFNADKTEVEQFELFHKCINN